MHKYSIRKHLKPRQVLTAMRPVKIGMTCSNPPKKKKERGRDKIENGASALSPKIKVVSRKRVLFNMDPPRLFKKQPPNVGTDVVDIELTHW